MRTIEKKIFLDDLPKKYGIGANKDKLVIDWINCVNHKVRFIYDDIESEIEIVGYDTKSGYLKIQYLNHNMFRIHYVNFVNCQLGKLLGRKTNEFKVEIRTRFIDSKRDLTIIDREYRINNNRRNLKFYKYKCNICGFCDDRSWILEGDLLRNIGCSCCDGKVVVEGINDISTTAAWMVKYFQNPEDAKLYTKTSGAKVYFKCPDCRKVKNKPISIHYLYNNHSIGCDCGDSFSYGHKYIFNLLEQLGLNFISNYKFDWCKYYNTYKCKESRGEYDFIIENLKLIIEVDGDFHRKDNSMSGQSKEESKFIDDEKDRLAKENGYKIIRIYYDDKNLEIKEHILKSNLIDYFDLSNIDWKKCEEFALSNLVKKVCEIKAFNQELSTTEIGKILKLNNHIIRKYLIKGSKIWDWVKYNPKDEISKASRKAGKTNGKPVEIFKNNSSLEIFISASELERQSESLFGIKLMRPRISEACRENKEYKGFTFKYVNNNNEALSQVTSF